MDGHFEDFATLLSWHCQVQQQLLRQYWKLVQIRRLSFLLRRLTLRRRARRRRRLAVLRAAAATAILEEPRRGLWVQPRSDAWWQHVRSSWTERDWVLNFRMRRSTFRLLCERLRASVTRKDTKCRLATSVELRVAICLLRLATHLPIHTISHLFGVGLSSVCVFTQQVISAINRELKAEYLHSPSDAEFRDLVDGFRDRWGFPQCVGVVGGTRVNILAPSRTSHEYCDAKGTHTVFLQAVVDHDMKFWDVNVAWPGRVPETHAFFNWSLYEDAQAGRLLPAWKENIGGVEVPLLILGDATFPLLTWLMTPYPEEGQVTAQQAAFNQRLRQARGTAERAFGRLKGRWTCLLSRCDFSITRVSNLLSACCVLHNFCEAHGEEYVGEEDDEAPLDEGVCPVGCESGGDVRNALCAHFSSL
ncbi:uncharacterized protein LOC128749911 [Synchiropus splendidus]|uniref:uncharacterized protein LOC128749911 n=1 Tax=Synchiropus splendidus TaxID=270530 RepID=UPI00237ED155|nr:uncharacterized protein LOC128749911 [Synchiropus splendidus]